MTTTAILAVIGGTAVILTAAARVPAALAEFLKACILAAAAFRELRDAITKRPPHDTLEASEPETGMQTTLDISADDSGN